MGQLLSFVPDIPVFVVDDDLSVREALVLLKAMPRKASATEPRF